MSSHELPLLTEVLTAVVAAAEAEGAGLLAEDFEPAPAASVKSGGDTDTNTAVAGALLGAAIPAPVNRQIRPSP